MSNDELKLRNWEKPPRVSSEKDTDLFRELMGWEIVEERFTVSNVLVADLRWKKDVELYESYVYNENERFRMGKVFQSKTVVGAKFKADLYLKSLGYIFDDILSEKI